MHVRVAGDKVEIEGYVNAIERNSKPLFSRIGRFIERICKGAFKKAIARNENIRLLLNHDEKRDLGGTADGNLELEEDSIGLHARAIINDAEVAQKARNGDLVGWSFGFMDRDGGVESGIDEETKLPLRKVRDLDLMEVSLLDRTKTPAYDGTLVSVRSADAVQYLSEAYLCEFEVRAEDEQEKHEEDHKEEPEKEIDYTKYEQMLKEIKEAY